METIEKNVEEIISKYQDDRIIEKYSISGIISSISDEINELKDNYKQILQNFSNEGHEIVNHPALKYRA